MFKCLKLLLKVIFRLKYEYLSGLGYTFTECEEVGFRWVGVRWVGVRWEDVRWEGVHQKEEGL